MATPPNAVTWEQPLDPADKLDYVAQFGQLLAEGETIESFTATVLAESAALGLTILEGTIEEVDYGPFIADDTNIELWFEVAEESRADAAFSAGGISLPIEIAITTGAEKPRRFQRTFVLKVLQL